MRARIPRIKVADDGHSIGVWRPDGEVDARGGSNGSRMGAKLFVKLKVGTFVEKVEVVIRKDALGNRWAAFVHFSARVGPLRQGGADRGHRHVAACGRHAQGRVFY